MAVTADLFRAVAVLATGAKARNAAAHRDFLAFYRDIVETVSVETVAAFGSMSVDVVGKSNNWAIELTATDYVWWKEEISRGARFVKDPSAVRLAMLNRLSKQAEATKLTPDERKSLIALLETAVSA